ncbi:GNAT family N-acetyltransferase [Paenibacillus sp. S-38]|uniref:GNAT family N-acetyltransferase n=1 Tax=Paenibacillus sp. S-38 TaxID=3416710 RepID=UPI003CFA4897
MTLTDSGPALRISCDRDLLDEPFVYEYLHRNMYWAKSLTWDQFQRSLDHSALLFGVYDLSGGYRRQAGFARVVSDLATFAYLTDVFITEESRGLGWSKQLLQAVMAHPQLQGLRRFLLVTEDSAGLYAKFGFRPLEDAGHWMQVFHDPGGHAAASDASAVPLPGTG